MALWSLSQFCFLNWITMYSVMEVAFISLVLLSDPSSVKTERLFFIADHRLGFLLSHIQQFSVQHCGNGTSWDNTSSSPSGVYSLIRLACSWYCSEALCHCVTLLDQQFRGIFLGVCQFNWLVELNASFNTSTCQGRARQLPSCMPSVLCWNTRVRNILSCFTKVLRSTAIDKPYHSTEAKGKHVNNGSSAWSFSRERREELW